MVLSTVLETGKEFSYETYKKGKTTKIMKCCVTNQSQFSWETKLQAITVIILRGYVMVFIVTGHNTNIPETFKVFWFWQ